MIDRKSLYALNKKDPEAIVYTDADKHIIRLTREDFDTEADYLRWKEWSDQDLHDEEKRDHRQANHTVSITGVSEMVGAVEGPEIVIEQRFDKLAQDKYTSDTVIRIRGQLTEKQFCRLWMYYAIGMTQQQIADAEKVGQRRISASIASALRRIRKIFFTEEQNKG